MSPLPIPAVNYTLSPPAPSFASNASGTISTIVFGILAVAASIMGIWQARKAWDIWQEHHHLNSVISNGLRFNIESHRPQLTDPVHQGLNTATAQSPRPVSVVTTDDTDLPPSDTDNHSQIPLSTLDTIAPPAAHPAVHPSLAEDSAHTTGGTFVGMP